jgi:capsular polysaccharide export protein
MLLYPAWHDPFRDRLCDYETAAEGLAAETRAWAEDHRGWAVSGVPRKARRQVARAFGRFRPVVFSEKPGGADPGRRRMSWAGRAAPEAGVVQLAEGVLRRRGLAAALSFVLDDLGMFDDPAHPSRLERLIAARARLRPDQRIRAEALIARIRAAGLARDIAGTAPQDLPAGYRVLVPGQAASAAAPEGQPDEIRTERALLEAARTAHPRAAILHVPHGDAPAGPRHTDAAGPADRVLPGIDPAALLGHVDAVWTLSSLAGFEALLHGVPVTTLGAPFYAGWGLTEDRGPVPPRRRHDVTLPGLVHACLVDYPRYTDPVTGAPCPVEVILDRVETGADGPRGAMRRVLAALRGRLAGHARTRHDR